MKFTFQFLLMILLLSVTATLHSQIREKDEESKSSSPKSPQITGSTVSVVMDGPVDPKEYIIGPGDIFNVSIWSAVPLNFQVPVTPEGSVVIPTVNEVAISSLTLENAKKLVLNEIKKKYISGTASFTLFQPRSFTVSIKGYVLTEQTMVVQATQRVDAVLTIANDIQKFKSQILISEQQQLSTARAERILNSASKRNIKIVRKDGSSVIADIDKYSATGNSLYNPLLHDGDVIIVPPNNIERNFIGLYGAVTKNGTYEFVTGDSLFSIIAIAGGLTNSADPEKVKITRSNESGSFTELNVDLSNMMLHESNNIALQRGDRIIVASKNSVDRGGVIVIEGEVVSPGSYTIIQDSTKLSEIVLQAGGLTKYAGLNGAVIVRGNEKMIEKDIQYLQMRKGYTTNEDTSYFTNEITLKNKNEIVSVDFISLLEKNDQSKDISLRDGDRIVIPARTNSIYIFGEVKNPGFIQFVKGKDLKYYIAAAGGQIDLAQDGDIKIIKSGSKQWLAPGETTIEEGDYVWVPKEPYRPFSYYLTIYSQIFGIVGTIVSLIILVTR